MATPRAPGLSSDVWAKRVNGVATLGLFGAVLGGAWSSGRAYSRWSAENHLFAKPRARVQRIRTNYQDKKANAIEAGLLIGIVLVEVVMGAREARPR
jgi:hypothetical protein